MKKLLIAFDFSCASFNAVHHAIRIAQQTKAQITFLCSRRLLPVQDDEPGQPESYVPGTQQPILLWQMLKSMLQALCIDEKPGQVNYIFEESEEDDSLAEILQKDNFDVVVVGMESAKGKVPFPGDKRMAQRVMEINAPVMVIPSKSPSQLMGTITLVTDSLNIEAKHALSVLFDLTAAFRAHLDILYVGQQQWEAISFRQAVKQLGMVTRLDSLRHTYHAPASQEKKELERMVNPNSTNLLAVFKNKHATLPGLDTIQNLILQSQVPLLLLPVSDGLARRTERVSTFTERAAFSNSL